MTAGKLNSNLVWLFALGAIVLGLGGGYATAGMGIKVSSGIFLGTYAVAGFLATFLTAASTGKAVLAFMTASALNAVLYYVVIAQAVAQVTEGAKGSANVSALFGGFAAGIVLVETLAAGIGGVVFGSKAKTQVATRGSLAGSR